MRTQASRQLRQLLASAREDSMNPKPIYLCNKACGALLEADWYCGCPASRPKLAFLDACYIIALAVAFEEVGAP